MTEVKLTRRWGSHAEGETVDVDDIQAAWLYGNNYAGDSRHGAKAPGEDGPDNRAGGDVSRLRMTGMVKSPREGNRAGRVTGAPSPVGDTTHVAQENLGRENREAGNDRLLASGKTLTDELDERQREIDARATNSGSAKDSGDTEADAGSSEGSNAPASAEGRRLTQPKRKD